MMTTRRSFLAGLGVTAATPFLSLAGALAQTEEALAKAMRQSAEAHQALADYEGMNMFGNEEIAMLLYPHFTALDLVGPQYMFASMMGAKVHLVTVSDTLDPVISDTGLAIMPTLRAKDCPENLDVFFVPGGSRGTVEAMKDQATVEFVKNYGQAARYLTSVCTGSLLLARAGLLKGKRATSHWVSRDHLASFGATPVDARVVKDGNVITGAGVTAGLDFGLEVVAALRSPEYAKAVQLIAEYAPEPPFGAGTEAGSDPEIVENIRGMFAPITLQYEALSKS